jgi:DNA end-binding protein Ku
MVKKAAEPKAPKAAKPNPVVTTPEKQTTKTSTWKGTLSIGLITFPVKSYKAASSDKIERNMYHGMRAVLVDGKPVLVDEIVDGKPTGNKVPKTEICMGRLKQSAMKCEACNVEVPRGQESYGVTVDDRTFLISDEEMDAQKPAKDDLLSVTEFVSADSIEPIYYESTEYLCSNAESVQLQVAYASFRDGLKVNNRIAIGRLVSRGHEYYVAIRPHFNGLVMSFLFAEYEIRNCDKNITVDSNPAYVKMFDELMNESDYAKDKFTAAPYDSYLKNVRSMIVKKVAGETPESPKQAGVPAAVPDMVASLQAMLTAAKKAKAARAGK